MKQRDITQKTPTLEKEKSKGVPFTTYVAALIAVGLWGFSFVWSNTLIINDIKIITFLFTRLFIAGILLFVFSKAIGKLQKIERKDYKWLFAMAASEPFIYFIGESYGMQATGSATITSLIIGTIPVVCLLYERVAWGIKFTLYKSVGILITIPGILLVVINDEGMSVEHGYGIALLFLAVFAATSYAIFVKKLAAKYNSFTIATYQFLIGALLFFPFFIIYGTDGFTPQFFTFKIISTLLSLAILCSCVAFVLWVVSIGNLGIARANTFSALMPGISALGAYMLGQEKITLYIIFGIVIVTTGVILAQHKESKEQ